MILITEINDQIFSLADNEWQNHHSVILPDFLNFKKKKKDGVDV